MHAFDKKFAEAYENKEQAPTCVIPGSPGIVKYHILNDRKFVLAQDSEGSVTLWDITKGLMVDDFGKVDFEEKIKDLNELVSVTQWFTVETKLGVRFSTKFNLHFKKCLEINLDFPQCFNAEIYAIDAGFPNASDETKANLGELCVKALFSDWNIKRKLYRMKKKQEAEALKQAEAVANPPVEKQGEEKPEEKTIPNEAAQNDEGKTPSNETKSDSADDKQNEDSKQNNQAVPDEENFKFVLSENVVVIIHNEKMDPTVTGFKKKLKGSSICNINLLTFFRL